MIYYSLIKSLDYERYSTVNVKIENWRNFYLTTELSGKIRFGAVRLIKSRQDGRIIGWEQGGSTFASLYFVSGTYVASVNWGLVLVQLYIWVFFILKMNLGAFIFSFTYFTSVVDAIISVSEDEINDVNTYLCYYNWCWFFNTR